MRKDLPAMTGIHPHNCWYVLATSDEVGREPVARREALRLRWRTGTRTALTR
jgi:hypothetical protein